MAPVEHLHRLGKPCRALANFATRLVGEERPLRLDLEPTEDPSPSAVDRRKVRGRIIGNERADPFTEIGDHVRRAPRAILRQRVAAVDDDLLSGDEACRRIGEEAHGGGDLVGCAAATERCVAAGVVLDRQLRAGRDPAR